MFLWACGATALKMMSMRNYLVIIILGLTGRLFGFGLQGYLSSSLYSFNRENREQTSLQHLRLYESFYLQGSDLGLENSRVTLAGLIYTDPVNAFNNDPVLRIYKASYRADLFSGGLTLDLGRQFVYSLATSGRMDGVMLAGSWRKLRFKGFGGAYVPASGWTGDPVSDYLAGAELKWSAKTNLKFGLGISGKNHGRNIYHSSFTYKDVEVPARLETRLAYQLEYNPGVTQFYIRGRQRLTDWVLTELTVVASRPLAGFKDFRFEYNFREPRIPENSIFSVFDASNTQDFRLSASRKIHGSLSGGFQIRHIIFDGERSDVLSVNAKLHKVQATYIYQSGYGGATSRVQLAGEKSVGSFNLYGRITLGRYKLLEGTWDDLATFVLGNRIFLRKRFELNTELQGLRNRYYDKDIRFLCTLMVRI